MSRFFLLAMCLVVTNAQPPMTDPEELTDDNFDEFVHSERLVIVKFYAPWCGHCKKMAPTWKMIASQANTDNIVVAKIDCTVQKVACAKYDVTGYPTIKYWEKHAKEPKDYTGGRAKKDFDDFISDNLDGGCSISKKNLCSDQEKEYLMIWHEKGAAPSKKEMLRIQGLKRGRNPDQTTWYKSRVKMLKSITRE